MTDLYFKPTSSSAIKVQEEQNEIILLIDYTQEDYFK